MREKAKDAKTYDVEDSETEPEPDKEAPDGATKAESTMVAYLEQMFSKRLDAMQSMVERLPGVAPPIRKSNPDSYADTSFTDEVKSLLGAGFIREVQYSEYLANVVMVKKKNRKWRVCIDFTDLNKSCPKDPFPLPHIDKLVDATAGHQLMSFMDAFSGYNQILMHPENQEKTTLMTSRGIYCYKVMPFGLNNA